MTAKYKNTPSSRSMLTTITKGSAFSIAASLLLAAIAAVLITDGKLNEDTMKFIPYAITFISLATGTILCNIRTEGKYAIINAAIALIYLFVLVASNIIFFDGEFNNLWIVLLTMVAVIVISSLISIKAHKPKKRRLYAK